MSDSFNSSDDEPEYRNIVIDNGSRNLQCGWSGNENPTFIHPSVIGRPRDRQSLIGCEKEYYVGNEAQEYRELSSLNYPIKHGIITNWDDMEKIWHHTFHNEMKVEPADNKILMTEVLLNPKKNRERMIEIMFEQFQFIATYIALSANLAMYASGRGTGIVVDIGDGVTQILPVYNGHTLPHAWKRNELAGSDLNEYLMKLLNQRGIRQEDCFTNSAELEIVRDIKEKLCYIATDYEKEVQTEKECFELEKTYQLPDGHHITVGRERFQCPEALFKPDLIGRESLGIHDLLFDTLMKCDVDLHKDLYCNIILSGGSTMFEGIEERLNKEMTSLAPPGTKLKIIAAPEREYFAWIGGSCLSSLSTFNETMWLSKQRYDEVSTDRILREIFDMI